MTDEVCSAIRRPIPLTPPVMRMVFPASRMTVSRQFGRRLTTGE